MKFNQKKDIEGIPESTNLASASKIEDKISNDNEVISDGSRDDSKLCKLQLFHD